ncbi:MAG TPA: response regulator, partial [Aquabacterium sp.]|nr:response regulator [Aquabacterium sp.]
FSVNDTGIGMTVAQQSRVFRPFVQADVSMTRRYGGTGLGLVISQQLIELLGGELKLESEPGKGSHFSFELSLVRAADNITTASTAIGADPQQMHAVAMSWPELKERSVLLVEDNEFNQLVASELLRDVVGMSVTVASSGEEALGLLGSRVFDAILMDIQMPGLDGYETTRRLRAKGGGLTQVPVIAMTAHATEEDRQRCLAAGMNDYISKPVMPQELFTLLQKWIGAPKAP